MKKSFALISAAAVLASATVSFAQIQDEMPPQYLLSHVTYWEGPIIEEAPQEEIMPMQFARWWP